MVAGDVGLALRAVDDDGIDLAMPPEILTWVGNVAPPIPTIPPVLTISTISSTLSASGSAGAWTSSPKSSLKSLSMTTDMTLPPME